ncbi:MAG: TrkH family potassium uptake protein [Eubacteriales bacterium]|nr:TrkH family potassium uptake protein [Eubacteriales bacterium]
MNFGIILHVLGYVCTFEAGFLVLPLMVSLIYREFYVSPAYLAVIAICLVLGFLILRRKPKTKGLYAKEGMVTVALSWIVLSLLGALPFTIAGEIPSYIDAIFETVSGFTTTGSSILTDLDAMSHASRFWRSFTHWVGGMGVLVFILAIVPMKGGEFVNLMRAESPGPSVSKMVPRLRDTAFVLYAIYMGLTAAECVILLFSGMPAFDAICITMGTAGTGGFSARGSGMADYTLFQQGVITVFMIMFGVNFNAYFLVLRKKWKQAIRSEEVLVYLGVIAASVTIITANIAGMYPSVFRAFHEAFFQVGSIITTTGYATADFNEWPTISRVVLMTLVFIGACAGSTGGGLKVSRVIIMVKGIGKEITSLIHPRSVKKVRMDGRAVEEVVVQSVNAYIALYLVIFVVSVLLIAIDNKDIVTTFTSVAVTFNNIGPGLGEVGPMGNFYAMSNFSKIVLSFDMLAGRLELLPILMIFVPSAWQSKHGKKGKGGKKGSLKKPERSQKNVFSEHEGIC